MRKNILKKSIIVSILAVVMLCSCTFFSTSAYAATPAWMQESLTKLQDWGVLKGYPDGKMHENEAVTRAQFVAMVNRAFGYTQKASKNPFKDVNKNAWYADDISIAYNAGYFTGTSKTTASPNSKLTREQAVALLARNLRLDEAAGQVMDFTDGDDFAAWSKGYIKSAVAEGIISGYSDGSFKPGKVITRGEMAKVLSSAIGNLVNTSGARSLGGTFGNVTLSTPGAVLRDTTIAGNLYLTGGVGLGDVILENVKVLGKIVAIGGGESQDGTASITMRNVTANDLVVDNMAGQYVSLSVDGDTFIRNATVKSSAYINDNTDDNHGIRFITLDAASGSTFNLSGNVKSVSDCTPSSVVKVSKGTVANLTVDEKATGSEVVFSNNAKTTQLNLDTATKVNGKGDIGKLDVAAPGCEVEMLPDELTIRPGVTAKVDGEEYGSSDASEISDTPRILAGYPKPTLLTSNSVTPVFQTNKRGTIYWVVAYTASPAIETKDIISPPADNSYILKSGSISVASSNKDTSTKVTGLVVGGKYTLYSVLVDSHDWESPVKSLAFQTTDDSVPAFTTGYPYMSRLTSKTKPPQISAMTTKDCIMYYALMPANSTAPSSAEFLAGSLSGNICNGKENMKKNISGVIPLSGSIEENTKYDLYLWLIDNDGAKSSAVKKLSFETKDETPPKFTTYMTATGSKATSIDTFCVINEEGTIYWAVVKENAEYPKPETGNTTISLTDDYAKLQIKSGVGSPVKYGQISAKASTDAKITISGLTAETAYDIYYVAVDKAGNYSEKVEKITANTADSIAPTVTQSFNVFKKTSSGEEIPYANTNIILNFSENIQCASTSEPLITLYNDVLHATTPADIAAAKSKLSSTLEKTIPLYVKPIAGQPTLASVRHSDSDTDWIVDYRNAKLELTDGKLTITLPTSSTSTESALNLKSGATYFIRCQDIADTSFAKNIMATTDLPEFTTISAQVNLSKLNVVDDGNGNKFDIAFSLTPASTANANDDVDWDTIIWLDSSCNYKLYSRTRGSGNESWHQVGGSEMSITSVNSEMIGASVTSNFLGNTQFDKLNSFKENTIIDYAIQFRSVNGSAERNSWTQKINIKVSVVSGSSADLKNLSSRLTENNFNSSVSNDLVEIGNPTPFQSYVQFVDSAHPQFTGGYPSFIAEDESVKMNLLLDRPGTIYYVVAPVDSITTEKSNNKVSNSSVPENGNDTNSPYQVDKPGYLQVVSPNSNYSNPNIKSGNISVGTGVNEIRVTGLNPVTDYYVYFVLKSTGNSYSPVYLYKFTTSSVTRPVITLELNNPSVVVKSDKDGSVNYMVLAYNLSSMPKLLTNKLGESGVIAGYPSEYINLTVLQAMARNHTTNNGASDGSVFDLWANQDLKDRVAAYIRTMTPDNSNIIACNNLSVTANTRKTIDCSTMKLSPVTQYAFLAVGRSNSGSGDAFRATYPIQLTDSEAPVIIGVSSDLQIDNNKASGTVSLFFNEDLYYLDTSGDEPKLYAIDSAPTLSDSRDKTKYCSCEKIKGKSSTYVTIETDPKAVNETTNGITLIFNQAVNGSYCSFKAGVVCDKYQNVQIGSLSVNLTIKNGEASISITSDWDGRGK